MADWTTLPDATFEPGAPAKGRDMRFLRDNPIAIAEGAPGAPRVQAAGLAAGNSERDWVLARIGAAPNRAIGTYMLATALGTSGSADDYYTPGDTLGGSSLSPASANGVSSGSMSGTWQCMGRASQNRDALNEARTTLWLRIS